MSMAGRLTSVPFCKEKGICIRWNVYDYNDENRKQRNRCYRELKSNNFSFAGTTWNFFASFDPITPHSQFGINVQAHRSDDVFDCYCDIAFIGGRNFKIKTIECKFKCESAGSHWTVTDFMTSSVIADFLNYADIYCVMRVEKSKQVCSQTEIVLSNSSSCVETQTQFPESDSGVVLEDSTFAGELSVKPISTEELEITWSIRSFLNRFWRERKKIASPKFSFANVTWHFCFSMDSKKNHSLFSVNTLATSSSEPECDFYCSISFLDVLFQEVKNIKCEFKRGRGLFTVTNFLSSSEIDNFEGSGANIVCRISVKNLSIKEACSQTEISYFTHSAVEAQTQTQLPEKADEELPMPGFDYKVLQDFKKLCLNGEGSDVTLQVEDQQFKAHRSFLTARSSVFAAMFNCDMKEKATGIVNVEDCELSSFPVFLEYLYCGSTEKLSSENVFNLYVSADKYDIQDLKRKCVEFMQSNLFLCKHLL